MSTSDSHTGAQTWELSPSWDCQAGADPCSLIGCLVQRHKVTCRHPQLISTGINKAP